jgi:DNA-binding beta-propeller fold protein YncE
MSATRDLLHRLGLAAAPALMALATIAAAPADEPPPVLQLYADHMPRGCTDLEFAPDGRLFVTGGSGGSGALYKVPAGGGAAVALVDSGLFAPWGLRFGPDGDLYVADGGDPKKPGSGRIVTIPAPGQVKLFKGDLDAPTGIVFDSGGDLFVALSRQRRIVKLAHDGTVTDYAKGVGAGANEPIGQLLLDKAGNLYAAAGPNIWRVAPGGATVTKVINGGLGQATGFVGWTGDNFIVSTNALHELRIVSPAAGVRVLTNSQLPDACTVGAMPGAASVSLPMGMRMYKSTAYVADAGCRNIRSFELPSPNKPQPTWGKVQTHYK